MKTTTTTTVTAGNDITVTWGNAVKADLDSVISEKTVTATAYASSKTFDLDDGAIQQVTLTGGITAAVTNQVLNRPFVLIFKQDATGGRQITLFSNILWAYGMTPTSAPAADQYSAFMFIPVADSPWQYLGFILGEYFA